MFSITITNQKYRRIKNTMKFIHQFYFILFVRFYKRSEYLENSIKPTPSGKASGYASNALSIMFWGWIILFYKLFIKITGIPVYKDTGKGIVVFLGLLISGLTYYYFENNYRYWDIYSMYKNEGVNRRRVIFISVVIYIIPYLLLVYAITKRII
jgi:hypothetical protein